MSGLINVLASFAMPLIKMWVDKMAFNAATKKSFYEFYEAFRSERGKSSDLSGSYDDQLKKLEGDKSK